MTRRRCACAGAAYLRRSWHLCTEAHQKCIKWHKTWRPAWPSARCNQTSYIWILQCSWGNLSPKYILWCFLLFALWGSMGISLNATPKGDLLWSERGARGKLMFRPLWADGIPVKCSVPLDWVISKFNGTSAPKASYSAKTGVNYPMSLNWVHWKRILWSNECKVKGKMSSHILKKSPAMSQVMPTRVRGQLK